jgi:hypothetical protein
MFASLSRGGSRIGNPYICSSCLSSLLAHPDPQFARLAANRVAPFSSTGHNGKSEGEKDTGGAAKVEKGGSPAAQRVMRTKKLKSKLESTAENLLKQHGELAGAKEKESDTAGALKKEIASGDAEGIATKSSKAANSKKKPATQTTKQEEKSDAGDEDARLAKAIESAKPATKLKQPIPKRRKGPAPSVSKKGKANSASTETKPTKKPSGKSEKGSPDGEAAEVTIVKTGQKAHNKAFAAQIKEHVNKFGEGTTRAALVKAIQGKGKRLTDSDQAEVLEKLKSMTPGLPRIKRRPQLKGTRSIKEAMNKVSLRKRPGPATVVRMIKPLDAQAKVKKMLTDHEIETIDATSLELVPTNQEELAVPSLSYGLERVLFNPGVYQLQDPRSRVFNFDPYLQTIMPVTEFDFTLLKKFITSSRDKTLLSTAAAEKKKYTGSTSSMTSALAHFHYLLSQWRPINPGLLSKNFPAPFESFTALHRSPTAIFLRYKDGVYAIDADKQYDTANVLSMLGQSMEKLLTLSTEEFEQYRKHSSDPPSEEARGKSEAYHYTTMGDFLMRSQLDAHDPRIPGTGMFDLKTRAVVSIRMDTAEYEHGSGYEIRGRHGEWESYEREYYDMIRSAFLKYSLQVRMGRMDGIFVAFHNTLRIFGFQYISLPEMDYALHGSDDTMTGDSEFKLSLSLLNRVLDRATTRFPEKSIRLFFETRPQTASEAAPYMYIFAEPVEEEEIEKIQSSNKDKIEEFERTVLGLHREESEEEKKSQWENLQAKVEASIENDEHNRGEIDAEGNESDDNGVAADFESEAADEVEEIDEETGEVEEIDEEAQHDSLEETEGDQLGVESEEIIDEDATAQDQESEAEEESVDIEGQEEEALEDEESGKEEDIIDEDASEETLEDEESGKEEDIIDENASEEPDQSVSAEAVEPELIENEDLISEEPTEEDSTTATEGSSSSKEEDALVVDMMAATDKPILAMYLTIRNKVNGQFVARPDNLKQEDEWKVEYALAEIPHKDKARTLLEASQKRREMQLTKRKDDDGRNAWNSAYINNIRKLSDQGRKYRKEVAAKEKEVPIKVLEGVVYGKGSAGLWGEDGKKEGRE